MTKHNKEKKAGGTKCIMRCPNCDYSTIASIKDVNLRIKLHMKTKHGIDNYDVINLNVRTMSDKYHSNAIKTEPTTNFMADLLKLLEKK